MYALTLNFHGVVLKAISDSLEQARWLEAEHRLFIVPDTAEHSEEVYFYEGFTSDFWLSLARHGLFALHTAAFRNKGGLGILVVGPSGSGKSTIAYFALCCGYPYVSDDVALCRRDGEGITVLPVNNQIGIKGDLPGKIRYDVLEHHPKDVFCQMSPDAVVIPRIMPGPVSTLEKETGKKTLRHTLVTNIFWVNDQPLRGQQVNLLNELSALPAYTLLLGEDHKQRPMVALDLLDRI